MAVEGDETKTVVLELDLACDCVAGSFWMDGLGFRVVRVLGWLRSDRSAGAESEKKGCEARTRCTTKTEYSGCRQ